MKRLISVFEVLLCLGMFVEVRTAWGAITLDGIDESEIPILQQHAFETLSDALIHYKETLRLVAQSIKDYDQLKKPFEAPNSHNKAYRNAYLADHDKWRADLNRCLRIKSSYLGNLRGKVDNKFLKSLNNDIAYYNKRIAICNKHIAAYNRFSPIYHKSPSEVKAQTKQTIHSMEVFDAENKLRLALDEFLYLHELKWNKPQSSAKKTNNQNSSQNDYNDSPQRPSKFPWTSTVAKLATQIVTAKTSIAALSAPQMLKETSLIRVQPNDVEMKTEYEGPNQYFNKYHNKVLLFALKRAPGLEKKWAKEMNPEVAKLWAKRWIHEFTKEFTPEITQQVDIWADDFTEELTHENKQIEKSVLLQKVKVLVKQEAQEYLDFMAQGFTRSREVEWLEEWVKHIALTQEKEMKQDIESTLSGGHSANTPCSSFHGT